MTSCKQTQVFIPNEFIETVSPKAGSSEWYQLNHSKNEFAVKIVDKKLEIKKADAINECELNISKGKLVGISRGKWGGKLTFEPFNH